MPPFTRTKRTSYSQRTLRKTNIHSPAEVAVLKSFIVTVALSDASFGGYMRRINAQLIGKKSNLGVKMLHMPSVSESWALGSGLHLMFLQPSLKQ